MSLRTEIPAVVLDMNGRPVNNARCTVRVRSTQALATVYAARTGSATASNPMLTTYGRVEGWLDPGAYDLVIDDTVTPARFTPYTYFYESVSGDAGGIPGSQLSSPFPPLTGTYANRPAAGVAGRIYRATDRDIFSFDTGSAWMDMQPQIPLVSTLPTANLYNGMQVDYQTTQTGVVWRMRYDSTLGYWVFVGGLPMRWNPSPTITNGTAVNAWTPYGTQAITVPMRGNLDIEMNCSWGFIGASSHKYHQIVIRNSANTADVYTVAGSDLAWESMPAGPWLPLCHQQTFVDIAAGSYTVSFQYYSTGSNLYINNRAGGGTSPARIVFTPTRSG